MVPIFLNLSSSSYCFNNKAEFEVLSITYRWEFIGSVCKDIPGLLLSKSRSALKEITLLPYRTATQKLIKSFSRIPCVASTQEACWCMIHSGFRSWCSRWNNYCVKVVKRTLLDTAADLVSIDSFDKQDWKFSTIQSLNQSSSTVATKPLKCFAIVNGELHHRGSDRVLAQALSLTEAKEELCWFHDLSCRESNISLYRCLQRQGFYRNVTEMLSACTQCQGPLNVVESLSFKRL